ncbi:MAG: GNAT family N-acetyltransferase [Chloroflexi bacterium]|nr:GNAT family N-acetyltransferase [Chloroflexota bacterium]
MTQLTFHEVTPDRWVDFERLFESPGAPKYCWCMVWRTTPEERRQRDPASRKAAMQKRIQSGVPVGILGYLGDEPAAWCSIAPRETYRSLGGPPEGENVWSLACFYVPRRLRRQGLMRQLLAAAVDHARQNGAAILEAYPVEADAPSYRFMGFVPVFEEAGFEEVGRAGYRRHVMRLRIRPGRSGQALIGDSCAHGRIVGWRTNPQAV